MLTKLVLGKPQNLELSLPLTVDLWHNLLKIVINTAVLQDTMETLIILIMKSTELLRPDTESCLPRVHEFVTWNLNYIFPQEQRMLCG